MGDSFHRFGGTLWDRSDWKEMPADSARIVRALGPPPGDDEARRLPDLPLPNPSPPADSGPQPATHFVVEIDAEAPFDSERLRGALEGAALWGLDAGTWRPLAACAPAPRQRIRLAWSLGATPGGRLDEWTAALQSRLQAAADRAQALGARATPAEAPEAAARRTLRLLHWRQRFARSVELRLMATGRPFAAAPIWRTAYSLGMRWGDLDLFHWPGDGPARFHLRSAAEPGYFLPERAAEGERVAGLVFFFELPACPAPADVFDRMALALACFRERLGGHPVAADGRELDAEALETERAALEAITAELERLGIAPGSPAARALF